MSALFRRVAVPLLLALALSLPGAPASALTIGEERAIGQKILYSVRRDLHILDDPDISQYINRLGRKVLEVVGPQHFEYRFYVVRSEQFNAFAAPAGMVFFFSGLIEAMREEDELVSVMAHEIGHVVGRHLAQRMERTAKVSVASLVLGLAGLALGVPGLSQGLLTGSLAAGQTLALQYSREHEEQADRLAFGWMKDMGRDPAGMRSMLRTMRRITRYRMNNVPQYLLTHPNPEARVDYVDSLIEVDRQQAPGRVWQATDNFDFLRFRARVLARAGDATRLRRNCLISLERNPDDHMARYALALAEAENRNFDEALRLLAQVRQRFPDRGILAVDQAAILQGMGRLVEARALLAARAEEAPDDLYGIFLLAGVEAALGNGKVAEPLLHRVAREMPEFPQVYYELARLEAGRGQEGRSLFYLGKHYLYEGREDLALRNLERVARDPATPASMREEAKQIMARQAEMKKGG